MSNPIVPGVPGAIISVNNGNKVGQGGQGKIGVSRVSTDLPSTASVFDNVLIEAGSDLPLPSRSVERAGGADMTNAQRLGAQLIELAKVEAIENIQDNQNALDHSIECMRKMYALLENPRVNVNQTDENGWTALDHAASYNNQAIVAMLLLNGNANKTIKNNEGKAPIDLLSPGSRAYFFLVDGVVEGMRRGDSLIDVSSSGKSSDG